MLYLTNRFFLCSCPLTKTHSCISFNHHLALLSSVSFSTILPLSTLFILLSFHSLLLCCPAAQPGRLSRLPLVVLLWPCDDCVLYQSITCVLAQPLPVPCTHRVDLCAVAALTDRRAAWPPLCRPMEPSTLRWWEYLVTFKLLTPKYGKWQECRMIKPNNILNIH